MGKQGKTSRPARLAGFWRQAGRRAMVRRLEAIEQRDLEAALELAEQDPGGKVDELTERFELYDMLLLRLGAGRRAERLWGAAILLLCAAAVGIAWSQRQARPEIELDAKATVIRAWRIDAWSWRGHLALSRGHEQTFAGFSEVRIDGGRVLDPRRVAVRGKLALESLLIDGDGPVTWRSPAQQCVEIRGAAVMRAVIAIEGSADIEVDTAAVASTLAVAEGTFLQLQRAVGAPHEAEVRLCFERPLRLAGTAPEEIQISESYASEPGKEVLVPSLRSGTVTLRATGQEIALSDRDKLVLQSSPAAAAPAAFSVLEIGRTLRLVYQGRVDEIALVHGRYEKDLSPTWLEVLQTRRLTLFFGTITTLLGMLWGLRKLFLR